MMDPSTGGSGPNQTNPDQNQSLWKTKIGGGAIGLWLVLALARTVPKLIDNANNRDARPAPVQGPPDMERLHAILNGVARRQQKPSDDEIIATATDAIRANPKNVGAYRIRGSALQHKGQDEKAIADYNEALRLAPQDPIVHFIRGVAFARQRDYDKAISDYSEAIRLDPKLVPPRNARAGLLCEKKEYDKAISDYREAIGLNPNDRLAHNGLAWMLATCPDARLRNGKEAVKHATKACQLSQWKQAYCLGTLAAAYAEIGDFDSAVKSQTKATALYSDDEKREWAHLAALYAAHKPYRAESPK